MKWYRRVEYNTAIMIDDKEYHITARKEGGDDTYAIEVNNEYVADCEELPTYEYIEQIIREELQIEASIGKSSYNLG